MRRTPHSRLRTTAAGALAMILGTAGLAAIPGTANASGTTGAPRTASTAPTTVASTSGGTLAVQYRTGVSSATASQSAPWFKIRNTGTAAVPLSSVKLRYYLKADAATTNYRFACDWAVRGCSNVTGSFGTLARPTATADRYLEIGFSAAAGTLAPGADSGDIQVRFHRTDWQQLVQSDDHSFGAAQSAYADWPKVTAQLSGTTVWGTEPGGPVDPPPAQTLFDDFAYTAANDPRLTANGWMIRSWGGGPGVPGATWSPQNIGFGTEGGSTLLKLSTSTEGTAASTRQAEISTNTMKFRNGTYAARVKFSDAPVSGPDGDHVIQTFFAINDLKSPMADDYAEYDFEYLPNGGWGETSNAFFTTSWETYHPTTGQVLNTHTVERQSFDGWRDLVFTIDDQDIRYYVDGRLFGTHSSAYLPERGMLIAFNQWLTSLAGQTSTAPRTYEQQVDYVLHVKDRVLTPAEVASRVAAYRTAGTSFEDTVTAN
ncbi:cellulose binding domain-containing protein [Streptomyces tsukubensis]|uniref:cellulose binding domain-containing protein n=1 Tax=Streptomyces tsukubensis TaxID=83656 RepID=UPI0036CC5D36